MKRDDLIDAKGLRITAINNKNDIGVPIEKLSDLGENWEINSECPACQRALCFTKENVNKILYCKCGQQIYLEIPKKLL